MSIRCCLKRSSGKVNVDGVKDEKGQQPLEPNHTHFLLLDDGTYYQYETGDYRTRLVKQLSLYHTDDGTSTNVDAHDYFYHGNLLSLVPIVTIVVDGGPDTLLAIYNDLKNDIPVVLIDVR
jgi:phage baseplate assembly protein gpV